MFCTQCGKEIRDDAVFCQFCGKPAGSGREKGKVKLMAVFASVAVAVVGIVIAVVLLTGGSGSSFQNAKKGDIITFGSYEQDGNTSNGKEPIEWEVLDADGDSVLVVSKCALDCVPYHKEWEEVTWETCTLREWLNRDFYENAFTLSEQARILESRVDNPDNAYYYTQGGNETRDKVFCLSVDEVYRYYELTKSPGYTVATSCHEALIAEATPYARNSNLRTHIIDREKYKELKAVGYSDNCIDKVACAWWLRSPGNDGDYACFVHYNGYASWRHDYSSIVANAEKGVRPALRLRR